MDDWVGSLKLQALLERGVTEPRLVNLRTEFDLALVTLAGRVLQKSEKIVFFYLYACTPTWEDIVILLEQHHNKKELDPATVRTYAARALDKIIAAAKSSDELRQWQKKFSKSQE